MHYIHDEGHLTLLTSHHVAWWSVEGHIDAWKCWRSQYLRRQPRTDVTAPKVVDLSGHYINFGLIRRITHILTFVFLSPSSTSCFFCSPVTNCDKKTAVLRNHTRDCATTLWPQSTPFSRFPSGIGGRIIPTQNSLPKRPYATKMNIATIVRRLPCPLGVITFRVSLRNSFAKSGKRRCQFLGPITFHGLKNAVSIFEPYARNNFPFS